MANGYSSQSSQQYIRNEISKMGFKLSFYDGNFSNDPCVQSFHQDGAY